MATWGGQQPAAGAWGQPAASPQQTAPPAQAPPQQQPAYPQQPPQQPAYPQQHPGYAQQPATPQQPGYPPPGGYYGQPAGCCVQDPNAPPQAGCMGPPAPPGQQPPGCCDPDVPCMLPPPQSSCGIVTTCCDCTFMLSILLVVLNIVAFGLVVGLKDVDDLFTAFRLSGENRNTVALQREMMAANATTGSGYDGNITRGLIMAQNISSNYVIVSDTCTSPAYLSGGYGDLCLEDSLTAIAMVLQISHWVNFRNTIYFLSMMGSLLVPLYVFFIHRMRHPPPVWQPGQQMPPASPPITFYGTPFYHLLRACWFVVGLVVFFWICTEMYQFWWFIEMYIDHSNGELRTFWQNFHDKMVATVVIGGTFLCWPFALIILEVVFFFLLIGPYFIIRMVCLAPNIQLYAPPADTELEDMACWRRIDLFFMQCYSLKRMGFSSKMWVWITGGRDPCLDCGMEDPPLPPPPPPFIPGAPQQYPPMGAQASPQRRTEDDDQVMTDSTPAGSMTRGMGAQNVAPPPPGGSMRDLKATSQSWANESGMRSSAAFSEADSDDGDLRKSKSKSHKSKSKSKREKSRDSDDDNDLRKSKDKSKKKKSKRDKE